MGKSKAKLMATIEDGGFVPRQSSLVIQMHENERRRKEREVESARRIAEYERLNAEYFTKEKERKAADAERLKAHNEELRRKQKEFDEPLPDFPPRIPQEVRGKFFQYVAHVVSDTLWNLEYPEYRDDPYGDERENAALLGEKIPQLPRKKVPAECLKAALRISTLGMGGLAVRIYIFVDTNHPCFNKSDEVWLSVHIDGFHFDRRMEYRIKRNLWKEKNVPYFASFDPEHKSVDRATQVIEWDVHRERDFELLKKSGFLYPDEKRVIHLEIF